MTRARAVLASSGRTRAINGRSGVVDRWCRLHGRLDSARDDAMTSRTDFDYSTTQTHCRHSPAHAPLSVHAPSHCAPTYRSAAATRITGPRASQNTHSLTHAACVLPRPTTRDAASQNMFLFINKTTITTQISQQYVACIEACTDIRSPAPPVLESILTVSDTFRWLVRTLKPD